MNQEQAFKILTSGKNCFLTGKAGTGKSYLTQQYIEYLKENNKEVIVCAPTGVAAINIGGATIHSTFIMHGMYPFLKPYKPQKIKWVKIKTLILDEVSMVGPDYLDYINFILQEERWSIRPFGWIQVVLVGDEKQLPPVYSATFEQDQKNLQLVMNKYNNNLVFTQANAFIDWEFESLELDEVKRQTDPKLIDLLNRVREWDLSALDGFQQGYGHAHTVHLRPYNKMVNSFNDKRLALIKEPEHTYLGIITDKFDIKNAITPQILVLKKWARVMVTVNHKETWLVNGDMGTIIDLDDAHVTIVADRFPDKQFELGKYTWNQIEYAEWDEEVIGTYTQMPLKLAWALTVHKSQGLTLESVSVNIVRGMQPAMLYVALSRCVSWEGLYVNKLY